MADLAGLRVLVTRPAQQAQTLIDAITARGGQAIHIPLLDIEDTAHPEALRQQLEQLDTCSLAIFVSANAATFGFAALERWGIDWPSSLEIAAVGRSTATVLAELGHPPDLVPEDEYTSEGLLALPRMHAVDLQHIVIFRGEGGREMLAKTLRVRGAEVSYAECYRRAARSADSARLNQLGRAGEIDIITATSNEILQNLYDCVGDEGRAWLLQTPLVVLSERAVDLAARLGFQHPPLLAHASSEGMIDALGKWQRPGRERRI